MQHLQWMSVQELTNVETFPLVKHVFRLLQALLTNGLIVISLNTFQLLFSYSNMDEARLNYKCAFSKRNIVSCNEGQEVIVIFWLT
jgi:hypothetical protein